MLPLRRFRFRKILDFGILPTLSRLLPPPQIRYEAFDQLLVDVRHNDKVSDFPELRALIRGEIIFFITASEGRSKNSVLE